jgi:hypothetical protein
MMKLLKMEPNPHELKYDQNKIFIYETDEPPPHLATCLYTLP